MSDEQKRLVLVLRFGSKDQIAEKAETAADLLEADAARIAELESVLTEADACLQLFVIATEVWSQGWAKSFVARVEAVRISASSLLNHSEAK